MKYTFCSDRATEHVYAPIGYINALGVSIIFCLRHSSSLELSAVMYKTLTSGRKK